MQTSNTESTVILVGFMGSGKTTFGEELADALNYSFIDSDAEIEKQTGLTINEIFESKGESHFRELESNFLQDLRCSNSVVATGGGMPCFNRNMDLLKSIGSVFYINTPFGVIFERLKKENNRRPLLKNGVNEDYKSTLLTLFTNRNEIYKQAHFELDGVKNNEENINQTIKLLNT